MVKPWFNCGENKGLVPKSMILCEFKIETEWREKGFQKDVIWG